MSWNPASLKLRAAYSRILSKASSGTVMVPGNLICPVGGTRAPSGTYAITGATSPLPSARGILSERERTRKLCLPKAICEPFCSVPPIGTMTVVLPARIWSRNSVQVSSSRNTLSDARAAATLSSRQHKQRNALAIQHRNAIDDGGGDRAKDHDQPRRHRPESQKQERQDADREIGRSEYRARPHRLVERGQQQPHYRCVDAEQCGLHARPAPQRVPERQHAYQQQK